MGVVCVCERARVRVSVYVCALCVFDYGHCQYTFIEFSSLKKRTKKKYRKDVVNFILPFKYETKHVHREACSDVVGRQALTRKCLGQMAVFSQECFSINEAEH